MARIEWPDERCIVCLGIPTDDPASASTDAHVIPESVGGRLSASFVCRGCNSRMGTIEGALPRDVIVLRLVDQLEGVLVGHLVRSIRRHADYFADTDQFGRIDARFSKRGELTPIESETIRTDRNTLRQMESELRREGADDAAVEAKLEQFAQAPQGERIEMTPEFTVTKGIPLEPARRAFREALGGDDAAVSAWPTEWLQRRRQPEPKHGLAVQEETAGVVVTIWLFRELIWWVHFVGATLRGVEPFYVVDLVSGEENFE